MGFPGTWMTESETLVYRVIPKCACSTIGQIMHYTDHGRFFDGDIHDAKDGILKWAQEDSQPRLARAVRDHCAFTFTCVRNPYSRVLSAFFDKICGIQRNGRRYRGKLVPLLVQKYGINVEGEFDQIASFRRFLLFARDTIRFRRPMDPDIHWSSVSGHASTLVQGGGRYDRIISTEDFKTGMKDVLAAIQTRFPIDIDAMPRFNESEGHGPKRAHPLRDYFDDLSMHLVMEMYHRDFELFKYDRLDPANKMPVGEIDLDEVHAKLGS
ncbi:MAG: sulfotransferase family protein [Paracoccaceae bacterium]